MLRIMAYHKIMRPSMSHNQINLVRVNQVILEAKLESQKDRKKSIPRITASDTRNTSKTFRPPTKNYKKKFRN